MPSAGNRAFERSAPRVRTRGKGSRMRKWAAVLCAAGAVSLVPVGSEATVIKTFTGTTPGTLVDVQFTASLTISGNNLTVVLTNDSLNHPDGPSHSRNPNDLLTSFYFDIFDG